MPDLRERFDYDAVLDNVALPAYDDLRREAKRRRARRTVSLGGLAVLMLVAAAGVPTLLLAPTPRPATWAQPAPLEEPLPDDNYRPFGSFSFFDARHGYLLYQSSGDGYRNNDACLMAMRFTDDGGESWSDLRAVPCVPMEGGGLVGGPRMTGPESFVQVTGDGNVFYRTRDAGRTWQRYRPRTRTVKSFPDGVVPQRVCEGGRECADDNRLGWYDPETGDRMRLAKGPDMRALRYGKLAADGSVWISGHADDGRYAVAVTRDNGRSWTTVRVDLKGKMLEGPNVATYDGKVGYLVVEGKGTDSDGRTYRRSIMRTDDGGESWSRVPTEDLPIDYFGVFDAVVTPDGALLIPGEQAEDDSVTWYVSHDGGVSFAAAKDLPVDGMGRAPGLYYGYSSNGDYYVSEDAVHWRKLDGLGG